MPSSHPAEIYAEELLARGHGYPLWFPEPPKRRIPRIGDVGRIVEGEFQPLLNVIESRESIMGRYQGSCPEGYVPMDGPDDLLREHENGLQTKVISSKSVVSKEFKANIGVYVIVSLCIGD
jgi:hypothetical protein